MKLVLAISLDKIHRFILSSVTKIAYFGVVSGIKEAYKGLLDGDILVGIEIIMFYIGLYSYGNQEEKRI